MQVIKHVREFLQSEISGGRLTVWRHYDAEYRSGIEISLDEDGAFFVEPVEFHKSTWERLYVGPKTRLEPEDYWRVFGHHAKIEDAIDFACEYKRERWGIGSRFE